MFTQMTKPTSQSQGSPGTLVADSKTSRSCLRSEHKDMGANRKVGALLISGALSLREEARGP